MVGKPAAAKRGSAPRFFGRQLSIHYRIFTKLVVLMGTIVPHHRPIFFQKRPPDGGDIGDAQLFYVGVLTELPEPERAGAEPSNWVWR